MKPRQRDVADHGSPERHAKGDDIRLVESERAGVKRAYNATESPLARYWLRGQLGPGKDGEARLAAGNRFYGDFRAAGLEPRVVGGYSDMVSNGSIQGYRVLTLDRYRQYMRARDAIPNGLAQVVYGVCCLGEMCGKDGQDGRRRLQALRLGLHALAVHYGWASRR